LTDLSETLRPYQQRIDQILETTFSNRNENLEPLYAAMRYVALGSGKRMRPLLVYSTADALQLDLGLVDASAVAIELIHAYSLVHDDLPAMDDDDLRRGRPSCHKAYDEATAILVGDALQALAFETLSKNALATNKESALTADIKLQLIETLASASGASGMVGGQIMDLAGVGKTLEIDQLSSMHQHKTGQLIQACITMPAICAPHLTDNERYTLHSLGETIGLAFQIRDDILDQISDTATLGKPQGSDSNKGKSTYVSLLGLDQAKKRCQELHTKALDQLSQCQLSASSLRLLVDFIVSRNR
jgi:geranylgeranyl pyrophosphate synthase|tara:strand:- start:9195 stop:10103 length:909 start_codon:yes stop_codon:yes gene_type:complete